MIATSIRIHRPFELINQSGHRFSIPPGIVRGVAAVVPLLLPTSETIPRNTRRQFLAVCFTFADKYGRLFRYDGVFDESLVLPRDSESVRERDSGPGFSARMMNGVTVRDLPTWVRRDILAPRGAPPDGDIVVFGRAESGTVCIRLGVRDSGHRGSPQASGIGFSVDYDIPLEQLLWRPGYVENERGKVKLEAADHVRLTPLRAHRMHGVVPSGIVVSDTPQAALRSPNALTSESLRSLDAELVSLHSSRLLLTARHVRVRAGPLNVPLRNGTMSIRPGTITGALCISEFTAVGNSCSLLVIFDFLDSSRKARRYASAISCWDLLPGTRPVTVLDRPPADEARRIEAMFDSRDNYEIPTTEGPPLRGRFKYTGASFWLEAAGEASEIDVTCRLFCPDDPRGLLDQVTFRHALPIERLLWRRAPAINDEVLIEELPWVFVTDIDSGPQGLAPSPIEIDEEQKGG